MAKNTKPYETPLERALAQEILNIPVEQEDSPPPKTIGEAVSQATGVIEQANVRLSQSPLATIVADTLMRQLKKRGAPSIFVRPDGTVVLRVSYEEVEDQDIPKMKTEGVRQSKRPTSLPSLEELRERAEKIGLEISDLGRRKREILKRVEAAELAAQEDEAVEVEEEGEVSPPERLVDEVSEGPAPDPKKPKDVVGGNGVSKPKADTKKAETKESEGKRGDFPVGPDDEIQIDDLIDSLE